MELSPKVADERLSQLDRYFQAVHSVILARQHPVTGLLPASTAVTVHGDYTDAWVRDNVYSIYAVWGLALAYRRHAPDDRRSRELEHAVVRLMRGLLAAMMGQAAKVERFKHTQNPLDALHAKYDTAVGQPVAADDKWGHLQLDATSLYLFTLAQMIAGGIDLIWSPVEVAFVQNLIYYIGRAYRTPDYGIWERGNKINSGNREINASSVGMALAALEALDGFNLYGPQGDRSTQVHVLPDEIARARVTLHSLLPRESASKQVDAATLAVIGFPAFAVTDEELVDRTRSAVVELLQGRYGCKRFLRDGHQTVLEDHSRLHYEASELKVFEHVECEWPLFFSYLLLDAHYREDVELAADYRRRLQGLEQRNNGVGLLPELYYVPASSIEAEKANPGSQDRLPNENVPLVWAQSLWWLAQMLDDGLLDRSDVDPLGRHRRRPKPAPPVQIALLAEDLETQTQLANLGIRAERMDELESIELRPAQELARFYSAQGASPVLGLSGRPERRLRTLTTARFYRLGDRRLAFAPSVVAEYQDHLALDMAILCQRLRSEVAYLSQHWQSQGLPTLVVPLGQRHLGDGTDLLSALLHEWRDGRCGQTVVRLGALGQFMASADWRSLDPNVGSIPEAGSGRSPQARSKPTLQHQPGQNLPLSAADELALELEAAQDQSRRIERLKASDNIYEQAECLQGLVLLLGRESEIPWEEASAGSGEGTIALEALLDQLWQRASQGRHWSVLRRIAGLRLWFAPGLEEAVTNLLVRQKHVVVGKAYSPESLITEPMGAKDIAEKIARFSREDVRERVLAQEILLCLDNLFKLEPQLLRGLLTVRVGYLILLLTAEVAAEFSLIQDEAYEKLLGFSPSEVQSRLTTVLKDYAQAAELLERQEALHLKPGVEVEWRPTAPEAQQSSPTPLDGWLDHRRRGGALGQVPAGFYPGVWDTLEHCCGLVIGDKLERRNRMDSAPLLAEMTPGETNFARSVEHLLAKIDAPEYRHLTIEALVALGDFFRENPEFVLSEYLVLDVVIGHGVRLAWLRDHSEDTYEDQKALAWQRFYEEPPESVAHWIVEALRYLAGQQKSIGACPPLPA
ncbi:MAG TPA: glycoside hydrolase family 15 protein [Terrimicrobiaceae bacterium]|nr:glycoside hydrolase family 15 protein [Terrimicrobiaceae bacterium]